MEVTRVCFLKTFLQYHYCQRHSLELLKVWILAEKNSNIVTGHRSCIARRAGSCFQIAATIYLLDLLPRLSLQLPATLLPTIEPKEGKGVDFSLSTARLRQCLETIVGARTAARCEETMPSRASEQCDTNFLAKLCEANPTALGLWPMLCLTWNWQSYSTSPKWTFPMLISLNYPGAS